MAYYRSELVRDASGVLCCDADAGGRDVVTLSEGNAMMATRPRGVYTVPSDGTVDSSSTEVAPPLNWNGITKP